MTCRSCAMFPSAKYAPTAAGTTISLPSGPMIFTPSCGPFCWPGSKPSFTNRSNSLLSIEHSCHRPTAYGTIGRLTRRDLEQLVEHVAVLVLTSVEQNHLS